MCVCVYRATLLVQLPFVCLTNISTGTQKFPVAAETESFDTCDTTGSDYNRLQTVYIKNGVSKLSQRLSYMLRTMEEGCPRHFWETVTKKKKGFAL